MDPAAPLQILVVDDDPILRRALARSLPVHCDQRPCQITECGSGAEALALMTSGRFDCVFLDYHMPGGPDGLTVLRAARAAGVACPIIILTGEGNERLAVEMMKSGAADYLVKGQVRPEMLGQTLRHVLKIGDAEARLATAEAGRWESEQRFRRIFEDGPVGMTIASLDRRLIAVNAAFGRLVGRDPATLIGTCFDDITHPEDVAPNIDLADRMRTGQVRSYRMDKRYVHPDGTIVRAALTSSVIKDSFDQPAYMVSIVEDVTETRRAADALRASEARFRSLFEASPVGIALTVSGITRYVNPAYLRTFGYDDPGELLGRSPTEVVCPTSRAMVADFIARRDAGEPVPDAYDAVGLRRDGTQFPYHVRIGRLNLPEGPANLVFITDLTESNRLREQLLQAQKMESLGRLAGGIAHDFNNLLAVISGYAESLRRHFAEARPGGPAAAQMDQIERAADRGAALVKQLLAFSRSKPLRPRRLDLSDIARGVFRMLRQVIPRCVEIDLHTDGAPAWVDADPGQIEQMLVNLALNARDAMPDGGELRFDIRHLDVPAIDPDTPPGRFVLLTVSDTGRGMDPSTRSRLFEPFFTTKPDGTGLGLSIVYGIVKQQNGHLAVHSQPGHGTRFEILLPSPPDDAAVPSPPVPAPPAG